MSKDIVPSEQGHRPKLARICPLFAFLGELLLVCAGSGRFIFDDFFATRPEVDVFLCEMKLRMFLKQMSKDTFLSEQGYLYT